MKRPILPQRQTNYLVGRKHRNTLRLVLSRNKDIHRGRIHQTSPRKRIHIETNSNIPTQERKTPSQDIHRTRTRRTTQEREEQRNNSRIRHCSTRLRTRTRSQSTSTSNTSSPTSPTTNSATRHGRSSRKSSGSPRRSPPH